MEERSQTPFGEHLSKSTGLQLQAWFARVGFQAGDSILATVIDWETGRFQIEHEPAGQRRSEEIAHKNQELADLLFDVLEFDIRYADFLLPFEAGLFGKPQPATPAFTPQQGQQVYRFKAMLKNRPGLWRQIEIQGEQTLGQFDGELRRAFQHDWDHMGGFWRRVRRGQTKRFREIDLGNIDPFGEGEAAGVPIAALGLQPGDQLKYVYDFGDWIEHTLTLEAIVEPEAGVAYPHQAAQNKPRFRYCERCHERGRKTVAIYACVDCSNRQQRVVLLCDRCAREKHEDHHLDDVLY